MAKPFRVIDTGLREGRANIAFDQAMIDARQAGTIADTIRFIHFPPTALVGRHQALSQELKVDACKADGVGIVRRITGGGAIYLDEGQLGWAIVCDRAALGVPDLGGITKAICEAAAAGLSTLGINAQFRPRNDIEVEGRKISGTGGFFDGNTLIFQGTVLIDLNPAKMLAALNVPEAKLAKRALDDAAARVVSLKELLGTAPSMEDVKDALLKGFEKQLGISVEHSEPTAEEEASAQAHYDEEIGTDEFVYEIDDPAREKDVRVGTLTGAGGSATAHVRLEGAGGDRLREVLITGDFFIAPPRIIFDLESSLRGVRVESAKAHILGFFKDANVSLLSITPEDFAASVDIATGVAQPQASTKPTEPAA